MPLNINFRLKPVATKGKSPEDYPPFDVTCKHTTSGWIFIDETITWTSLPGYTFINDGEVITKKTFDGVRDWYFHASPTGDSWYIYLKSVSKETYEVGKEGIGAVWYGGFKTRELLDSLGEGDSPLVSVKWKITNVW